MKETGTNTEYKNVWHILLEKLLHMERNSVRNSERKGRKECAKEGERYE